MIDLHTHSNRSDGTLSPAELTARAAAAGVDVLALTDHDSTAGLEEAARAGKPLGVRLVPGVEISASWRSQAIHVLGLWIDPESALLRRALEAQADRRRLRLDKICAHLAAIGLPGAQIKAASQSAEGLPTRSHVAQALVKLGHAKSIEDAFRRYLGRGRAAAIAADWPALGEVVGWIRGAGGCAALAHPMRYALSSGARRGLLEDFKESGGSAIEVVTGGNAAHHIDACAALALRYGLCATVGSDFHDPERAWNPLGRLAKLPDCVIPAWKNHGV